MAPRRSNLLVASLRLLVAPLALFVASGCASSSPRRVGTVPDAAWEAAADSPRSSYPTTRVRTIRADRGLPAADSPLTREQVLSLANGRDTQDAIAEIDRHPLAFPLDGSNLAWFEDRLIPPEVVDYLKKRAQVDWSAMRPEPPRALDPGTPLPPQGESSGEWADAPAASPPPSTVIVEEAPSTVYYESSPTIIVGTSWYDGCYWRPWRPWYRRGCSTGVGVTYSSGYGGVYFSGTYGSYGSGTYGRAYYGRGGYVSPRSQSYGTYPYTQGSFVYAQPRGFVPPATISRPPAPQTRQSFHSGNQGGPVRTSSPTVRGGGHHH